MATIKERYERALYGASLFEVTLGALLSVALGAVLALAFLVFKPVETAKAPPEQPEVGTVYYVQGSANGTRGRQYLRKRQLLLEGGASEVITLSEDELNAWIASSRANPDAQGGSGFLVPQSVNFRVRESQLQIGLPCTLSLPGLDRTIIVQAKGGFEQRSGKFVYAPSEMYVGSLPAHRVPGLASFVTNRLMAAQELPPETVAAWSRLERVSVEGEHLVLAGR